MADVNNMKLFSFDTKRDVLEEGLWAAVGSFQEWFIKQTSHLEALRLLQSKPRLALCAGKLHHLKHLEMEAHAFVRGNSTSGAFTQSGNALPTCMQLRGRGDQYPWFI